jgi:hypothetical protein
MVRVRLPVHFYKRNETYYSSRSIPSDLQHRFNKRNIEVSLRTKSEEKAAKSAISDKDFSTTEALALYNRLKGG